MKRQDNRKSSMRIIPYSEVAIFFMFRDCGVKSASTYRNTKTGLNRATGFFQGLTGEPDYRSCKKKLADIL